MPLLPSPRMVVVAALTALGALATVPALAGPAAPLPASAVAPVAPGVPDVRDALSPVPHLDPAAAVQPVVADSVACELVRALRVCTHGDDVHLAASPDGATAPTSSTRLGCYGDGRSGPRVQAVYARPEGAKDRLATMLPSFRGWAGAVEKAVDDSAHKTGGARHVRFVTSASGSGCALAVLPVVLPASAFSSFPATISALQERGLDRPQVKYLVWADAAGYCGIATTYRDSSPGQDNLNNGAFPSYARIDTRCWGKAETHELTHMLGGVQDGAPHATRGMHCSDGADVMCYDDGSSDGAQRSVCPAAERRLLDCRSDDYFSTSPPAGSWLARHWNVAHSAFLARGWTDPAPAPRAAPTPTASPSPKPSSPKPSSPPPASPKPGPTSVVPTLPLPLPLPPLPVPTLPVPTLPTLPVPLPTPPAGLR